MAMFVIAVRLGLIAAVNKVYYIYKSMYEKKATVNSVLLHYFCVGNLPCHLHSFVCRFTYIICLLAVNTHCGKHLQCLADCVGYTHFVCYAHKYRGYMEMILPSADTKIH